ncbi:MAG: metallophosphoesterase [Proteobacteria bacterium]|nr:metallophosphoesterase [Pseudomonadota bacterium]
MDDDAQRSAPQNRRRRAFVTGAGLVGAVAVALSAWAFGFEPASLSVRQHVVALPAWPAELTGLRVAVLADIHTGSPWNDEAKLERIVAATNAEQPDLILLAGDFVIHGVVGGRFVAPEASARILCRLEAPLGVYGVLGNHDWWLDAGRIQTAFENAGIPILEDRAIRLDAPGGAFWLLGISDFWEGPHDVERARSFVVDTAPVLAFTHNPDIFPLLPPGFALTLAGHTHGGQVALPLLGRPIVPSIYGERFAIGHVEEDGRHLFVTPGLGTSILPVRFRVPPEISIVELRAAAGALARRPT